jgi:hypothetical protein
MPAPLLDRDYHVLEFESTTEAASFVAALSRFLNSPVGSTYVDSNGSVQVWSYVSEPRPDHRESVEVFMSSEALDAASAAFAPVLVSGKRRGDELPTGCTLVVDGYHVPPWGLTEVEDILIHGWI